MSSLAPRDRAARRRFDPALKIEPSGVLGGIAVAAPAENGAMLDDVVPPGLFDLARGNIWPHPVVLERANKRECSGDIIVGHDQRTVEPVVDIIFDGAELLDDAAIRPVLERPAHIDADQLAEHGGVSAFEIVGR
jgi:hypothetical protein